MGGIPRKDDYMNILVACEESQIVTTELRLLGHAAYSCDLKPTSGNFPEFHIQDDVTKLLKYKWDMMIAFPPCTYLTNAGTRHFSERVTPLEKVKERKLLREDAAKFFMLFVNADIPKIAIENPVGYMNQYYRKPDQVIHPYFFGDPYKKRTCLWLKNLPKLLPTNFLPEPKPIYISSSGKKISWVEGIRNVSGGQEKRAELRSKTFPGIAQAMALQWTQKNLLEFYYE